MSAVKKLCFVSPRYGQDIIGGAEFAIRRLAENCVEYGDVEAEVLSTTAGDERTWSQAHEPGISEINGVEVHRFHNDPIDRTKFDTWARPLLDDPSHVTESLFDEWLIKQGPYSPGLLDAIEKTNADAVVFHPMLSSPTSHGVFRSHKPVILHPALHNEPLSYMPGYAHVARRASLLAFSTRFEQQLAQDIFGVSDRPQSVIGFGIEDALVVTPESEADVLTKYGVEERRYFVVIGRVDQGKGSDLVAGMFKEARKFSSREDSLVFIGPISPSSQLNSAENMEQSVICTGAISDEEKQILLAHATALISPSVTESFSLVVLEAMKLGVPVIVNAMCGPTVEHAQASGGGVSFSSFGEFVAALNLYADENDAFECASKNGQVYVENKYTWSNIVNAYLQAINSLVL